MIIFIFLRVKTHPAVAILFVPLNVVAGRKLREGLHKNKVSLEHSLLKSKPVATDQMVERIQSASHDKVLIISVGSGTVNDLGKIRRRAKWHSF
jgi:glycerol-1-phosphate dehydrogenase [NAD(P)+]